MCAFVYKMPTGKEFWCKVSILDSKGKSGRTGGKKCMHTIVSRKTFTFREDTWRYSIESINMAK